MTVKPPYERTEDREWKPNAKLQRRCSLHRAGVNIFNNTIWVLVS